MNVMRYEIVKRHTTLLAQGKRNETKENLNEEETGDQQCLIVTFGRIP